MSSDDGAESLKVAVRVRPFNKRERERGAKLIVEMNGGQTVMRDPDKKGQYKKFAFDHSYWSHDGCKERADGYWEADPSHKNSGKFADQKMVFADLGEAILKNAWEGYNSTLFAYGQTGSGKSYSVVGYGTNKGIVPVFCEKIFNDIKAKKDTDPDTKYEVQFSMLEIYSEIVRDLLNPTGNKKRGLKVREHPKKGFYAEGLTIIPVDSYEAIAEKMEEGTTNRTIAATNMNATSSRAHTIVGIQFVQKKKNSAGEEMAKTSVNNLVDLAGSERVSSTGATGDRLKEGAAINTSLTALGNVISALADQSEGKKVKVPYRDSVLTKLLMNALGGNSKTVMIAAISPADINHDESLGTLRYADRAKQIKTKAVVNEDPTAKLIRDLQSENDRLKKMLKDGGGGVDADGDGNPDMTEEEKEKLRKEVEEEYKAQLAENERQYEELKKSFDERLAQSGTVTAGKSKKESNRQKAKYPHFYNLNQDPQLRGMIVHIIKSGKYKIGNQKGSESDIVMMGPSMQEQHGLVKSSKDHLEVILEKASDSARILVNGHPIIGPMKLHHNDRVQFGTTQMYIFANPIELKNSGQTYTEVSWEDAQQEIANSAGFDMDRSQRSESDLILQEELCDVMPCVDEANSISESLDKMMKFEMVLVSAAALGRTTNRSYIFVRARNFVNGLIYDWPMEKFMDRFYIMQEMYENYEEGEEWQVPEKDDPFLESPDELHRIGMANIYLKSLSYIIEMKSQLEVIDIRGNEVGLLNIEVVPCDEKGDEYNESSDVWVDNPKQLIGKAMNFVIKIHNGRGLPPRFTDICCKYKVYADEDYTRTEVIPDTNNPNFNHRRLFTFKPVTEELLSYLIEDRVVVEVWGLQMPITRDLAMSTRDLMASERLAKGASSNNNLKVIDMGRVKNQMDADVLKRRQEKMDLKITALRDMVKYGEEKRIPAIPMNYIKGVLDANNQDAINKWQQMYQRVGAKEVNGMAANRAPSAASGGGDDNRVSSKGCTIS